MQDKPTTRFGTAVRHRRAELGISLEQLATATGISRGNLSRVENNALNTSLGNAVAIAQALGCDLSDLLDEPLATITRANDELTYTDESGIVRTSLARPGHGIELIRFNVPAGANSPDYPAHQARTTETIHVLTGQLTYYVGDERYELDTGDTLTARADQPHHFTNPGTTPSSIHMIITTR